MGPDYSETQRFMAITGIVHTHTCGTAHCVFTFKTIHSGYDNHFNREINFNILNL